MPLDWNKWRWVCLFKEGHYRMFTSPYEQRHGGWPRWDACFGPGPSAFLSVTLCVHMKERTCLSISRTYFIMKCRFKSLEMLTFHLCALSICAWKQHDVTIYSRLPHLQYSDHALVKNSIKHIESTPSARSSGEESNLWNGYISSIFIVTESSVFGWNIKTFKIWTDCKSEQF